MQAYRLTRLLVPAKVACLLLFTDALAFNSSAFIWPTGQAEFKTRFANSPQPDAKFQAAFTDALQVWTDDSTFVFSANGSSSSDPCGTSTDNGIRFDDDDCGRGYGGSTVAVQRAIFLGGVRSKSVITFNSGVNWDVYAGARRPGSTDLRRVAVHELGHSLGLGHEDVESAIMQPFVSNLERPTADDQAGVAAMYDLDADGIGLALDNCKDLANADQSDLDMDDIGDDCDADIDGDGVLNGVATDQSFATDALINSFFSFGADASTAGWAQSFEVGIAGQLVGLSLPVTCDARQGGGASSLRVTVERISGGVPNGQVVDSINFTNGPPEANGGLITLDLSADNTTHSVTQGERLAFTLSSNGRCFWQRGNGSYADGSAAFSNNGSSWFVDSNRDIPFQTHIDPDTIDNCPSVANVDQADDDNNGVGNACEDPDGDQVVNALDNCPAIANADQANFDGDALGDVCDPDADNDGVNSANDSDDFNRFACSDNDGDSCDDCSSGSFNVNNDGPDSDNNGVCNLADPDDDGDGVLDNQPDNCPLTPNADQADSNADGVGDACEPFCVPIVTSSRKVAAICL